MELTRRQKNIIRKMIEGYLFGSTSGTNYMTKGEVMALDALGFDIQMESAHGSDASGGQVYYPLRTADFALKSIELGVATKEQVLSWKPALRSHIEKAMEGVPV